MASEVISHAIFASFHLTSRHAPHCLTLRLLLRASLHISPCTSLHISPCTSLHIPPCTPLFTLLCAALHPPRTALSSTPPPTPRSAPHLALHSHPTPHHALHPAPRPPFPSLSFSQVSSSSRPPISHPRLSIPLCSSAKPLHPVLHPASHHALRPDPHSPPPISIALLCSPGFL